MIKFSCFTHKKLNYIIILFLASILFLYLLVRLNSFNSQVIENQVLFQDVSFDVELSGNIKKINCWFSKEKGKNYLFLPSGASLSEVYISIPKNIAVSINGKTLNDGDSLFEFKPDCEYEAELYKKGKASQIEKFEIMISQNLPSMYIETKTGSLDEIYKSKSYKEAGKMTLLTQDGEVNYSGDLPYIRSRGNSTWHYAKKSYNIALNEPAGLIGMGEATDWVLLANYVKDSEIKNRIAFETAREVGLDFSVNDRFIDLYINNAYHGLFQLVERIEVADNRVEINDLAMSTQAVNQLNLSEYPKMEKPDLKYSYIPNDPDDITGGYLLELVVPSAYSVDSSAFTTKGFQRIALKSPEYASLNQINYISNLIQEAENSFASKNGVNSSTGKFFTEYIDLNSWVKKYLVDEIFLNFDSEVSSSFLYKDNDSKSSLLYAGPIWDYDNSIGNDENPVTSNPETFFARHEMKRDFLSTSWFNDLYKQEVFYEEVVSQYENIFLPVLTDIIDSKFDKLWESIQFSAKMNDTMWSDERTEQSIAYIKDFLTKRVEFLNSVWLENVQYHTVRFRYDSQSAYYYSVRHGDKLPKEAFYSADKARGVVELEDGGVFDLESPITQDIKLNIVTPKRQGFVADVGGGMALIEYLYIIIFIIMLLSLILIEIKNHYRYYKQKGEKNVS